MYHPNFIQRSYTPSGQLLNNKASPYHPTSQHLTPPPYGANYTATISLLPQRLGTSLSFYNGIPSTPFPYSSHNCQVSSYLPAPWQREMLMPTAVRGTRGAATSGLLPSGWKTVTSMDWKLGMMADPHRIGQGKTTKESQSSTTDWQTDR